MAKTRIAKIKKTVKKIEQGAMLAIDSPVRLDEIEVAEDLFGEATAEIDIALDDIATAKPTGERRWSSYDREEDGRLVINTCHEYILD